jgi:transposase
MLTPTQHLLLHPLFPPPSPSLRGRPPLDDILILDAILYKICHDLPWCDLPPRFPSHQTVYRRYRQWQRLGLWDRLLQALAADLSDRGGFSFTAAYAAGVYKVNIDLNHWTVTINPDVPQTWQVRTGWIFAWQLAHRAYRLHRDRRSITSSHLH